MPARFANERSNHYLMRSRGFERFPGALQMKLQQAFGVLGHPIDQFRRRNAVRIRQDWIKDDTVFQFRQIFADNSPHGRMGETLPEMLVKIGAPDWIVAPG